jgi:Conjugal transfer protein TrbH.
MNRIFLILIITIINTYAVANSYIKSSQLENFILDDVAARISLDYPAANTTLSFNYKDNLGLKLSQNLRSRGFAIADINTSKSNQRIILDESLKQSLKNNGYLDSNLANSQNSQINIVVDEVDTNLFRVTYIIDGSVTYSRGYKVGSQGEIQPAGSWTVNRK